MSGKVGEGQDFYTNFALSCVFSGGIMFWTLDNDDFRGTCSKTPYPLIESAKEAMFSVQSTVNVKT